MHFKKEKNRCFEWYTKLVYAGAKSARNILTNLSPNPARPEKPGPTYNSGLPIPAVTDRGQKGVSPPWRFKCKDWVPT